MVQGEEVETLVRAAREVETGRGYVELQRRYRVAGTQDVRQQSLLLGYKLGRRGGGWWSSGWSGKGGQTPRLHLDFRALVYWSASP